VGMTDSRNSGGCCWLDFNGDGFLDLFVAVGAHGSPTTPAPDFLYRNNGDGTFTDVAATVGLGAITHGASAAVSDYDGDGMPDIYVANSGTEGDRLFRNTGAGFADVTTPVGLTDPFQAGAAAAWADYDRDGDQDLAVSGSGALQNRLYQNTGEVFLRVDGTLGLTEQTKSVSPSWADYDGDGDSDLFFANVNSPDLLYRNAATAFVDVANALGVGETGYTHGGVFGDYDSDGDLDLYASMVNTADRLYRNDTGPGYTRVGATLGIGQANTVRAAMWGDYDNDGDLDLFATVAAQDPRGGILYRNDGLGFSRQDANVGILVDPAHTEAMAVAWADYDADGDLDLFVGRYSLQRDLLFRNDGFGGNWLSVQCLTDADGDATDSVITDDRVAYGTKVEVDRDSVADWDYSQGSVSLQYVDNSVGRCASTPWPHFGLDSSTSVHVRVTFVDGTIVTYTGVAANQKIVVRDALSSTTPKSHDPRFAVERFVGISTPQGISTDSEGNLYVGNDPPGGGLNEPARIRYVSSGGGEVREIGDLVQDPDWTAVDLSGDVAQPGSVIVAALDSLAEVNPVTGATTTLLSGGLLNNTGQLAFSSDGRLFVGQRWDAVLVVSGQNVSVFASFPGKHPLCVAIDDVGDHLYVGLQDSGIFGLSLSGGGPQRLVTTMPGTLWDLAFKKSGALDGCLLAVVDTGSLYWVDPVDGDSGVLVSGFMAPINVAVGPAGDLYVSDSDGNAIYRIWEP
ncbi:FG-GAP-like repeat-containing protein, partial [Planctomycetota bacterium]